MSHYKPYPAYRDSGVEWIGQVPEHWVECSLKHALAEMGSGGTPDTDNPDYWCNKINGTPWIAISDMSSTEFVDDCQKAVTQAGIESKRLKVFPQGTLLFSMYASLGHVAELGMAATTNQAILALLPASGINQRFLKRWLQSLQPYLVVDANNATQDNLNAEKVRNLPFVKAPLIEQQRIATQVDSEVVRIDALITKKTRFIELLKEKRQALITHAVTKGLDPNVAMKDSGVEWIGVVPAHWSVAILKRFVVFQRGHDLPSDTRVEGTVPVVSSGGYSGTHNVAIAKAPGIVTGRYGSLGEFTFVEEDYWPLNTALYSIELHNNDHRFVWYLLQNISDLFLLYSAKAAVPGIDRNDIHEIYVAAPQHDEQRQIAKYLDEQCDRINAITEKTQRSIDLLKERRAAFITAAVTGQIDLREAA